MQSNLTYMLTSGGQIFNMKQFLQHTLRARLFKLYKSRISDSRHACLTNGFARLRDVPARLCEVCESLASKDNPLRATTRNHAQMRVRSKHRDNCTVCYHI